MGDASAPTARVCSVFDHILEVEGKCCLVEDLQIREKLEEKELDRPAVGDLQGRTLLLTRLLSCLFFLLVAAPLVHVSALELQLMGIPPPACLYMVNNSDLDTSITGHTASAHVYHSRRARFIQQLCGAERRRLLFPLIERTLGSTLPPEMRGRLSRWGGEEGGGVRDEEVAAG